MKICSVKFNDNGKNYYFKYDDIELKVNLTVVVDTEKGEQFAKVTDVDVQNIKKIDEGKMKSVLRISTKKDYNSYLNNLKLAKEALDYARKLVQDEALDMRIVDATYTLDRKQLMFNFVADERVDFRNLVKDLAFKFKTHIDLHQMGARDKSKEIGGIGPCGRPLCCSSFLNGIESITINMAKNQNIALNPSKINGLCGRLLCCLSYEDEVYCENRSNMPKIGQTIKTDDGEGKVVNIDVLNKKYTVLIGEEKYVYDSK